MVRRAGSFTSDMMMTNTSAPMAGPTKSMISSDDGCMAEVPLAVNPTSHHRPGGGYQNPWPDTGSSGFGNYLRRRLVERRRHPIAPNPPRDWLLRRQPSIATPRAAHGYRSITWVGHATALLHLGPVNVLTDPVWSER